MMAIKEKDRVYVSSKEYEGMATVDYLADPGELFPVQVLLDQPDKEGHALKRAAYHEIKTDHQDQPETDNQRYWAKVIKPRKWYRLGEQVIVGPTKNEQLAGWVNVYSKARPNAGPVGTYERADFLEKTEPFIEIVEKRTERAAEKPNGVDSTKTPTDAKKAGIEPGKAKKRAKTKVTIKITEKKTKKAVEPKQEPDGQMNIFDLLEG